MKQAKWFERKFLSIEDIGLMPSLIERLEGTIFRIEAKMKDITEELLIRKENEEWSIKEEIGHLADLEPLWLGRIEDIMSGQIEMRATDLSNQRTHQANHNQTDIQLLISHFASQRERLIAQLQALTLEDLSKTSLHPRMKTPMKIIDLAYFVAEHDDHHLAKITSLKKI